MIRRVARVVGWLVLIALIVAIVSGGLYALTQWHPLDADPRNALELLSTRLNWTAIASIVTAVAVVVIAVFAINLSRVSRRALRVASDQVAASAAAHDAAVTAAETAIRAVEASAHSTEILNRLSLATERGLADERRLGAIAATPILTLGRPTPTHGPTGLAISLDVQSNGPGVAIDVRVALEAQAADGGAFAPVDGAVAGKQLLSAAQTANLVVPAAALQNLEADWPDAWPGGSVPPPPPNLLTPARIRFHLTWRAAAGANARLTATWATRDLSGNDPAGWQVTELRIEPAAGDPLVVA